MPNGQVGLAMPQLVVAAPVVYAQPVVYSQPVVEASVMVPDNYVMVDGEYVGLVGDQYFYLGGGGVWLACDSVRLERFHGWERSHPDWREHAIRNDRFRRDAHGQEQPRHDDQHGAQGHGDQHVQPGHGAPAKAAPKAVQKRKDEKDAH